MMKVKAWSATLMDNVRVVKVNASTSPPAKVTVMRGSGLRNSQVSKESHYRVTRPTDWVRVGRPFGARQRSPVRGSARCPKK